MNAGRQKNPSLDDVLQQRERPVAIAQVREVARDVEAALRVGHVAQLADRDQAFARLVAEKLVQGRHVDLEDAAAAASP